MSQTENMAQNRNSSGDDIELVEDGGEKNYSKTLVYSLYFVGFLEKICGSLVIPLLLRHFRWFGASTAFYGVITSTYGIINIFVSPFMGKMSDRLDRSAVLLICQAGMGLCYCTMGFAGSLFLVALTRVLAGFFKHSLSLVTAYLADVTPTKVHSQIFGQYDSMTSIAVIFGPALGGVLAMGDNGFFKVCMLATFTCAFNFVFILLYVKSATKQFRRLKYTVNVTKITTPCSSEEYRKETCILNKKEGNSNSVVVNKSASHGPNEEKPDITNTVMYRVLNTLGIASLYKVFDIILIQFLLKFSMLVISRNLDIILELQYAASPQLSGFVVSFKGFVGFLSGLITGHISKLYNNDARVLYHFAFLLTLSVIVITCSPSICFLVASLVPFALSSSVLRACTTSLTIKKGGHTQIGTLIGVSNSLISFAKMASPTIGGISQELSAYGPAGISIMLGSSGILILMSTDIARQAIEKKKTE